MHAQELRIPYTHTAWAFEARDESWDLGEVIPFQVGKQDRVGSPNRAEARFAWDENYLYGQVEVEDAELIRLRSGNETPTLNLNDAVEFFIDPLADSQGRMDINDYQVIFSIGGDIAIFKGDKRKIALADERAPKEVGTATMALLHEVLLRGSFNDHKRDSGYLLHFAMPWAALGVIPRAGHACRIDLCLDDMDQVLNLDTMTEASILPGFSYSNWLGDRDFSFPDRWRKATLSGGPEILDQYLRQDTHRAKLWILCFIAGALLLISFQYRRIRRLRHVPVKTEIGSSTLMHFVEQEPQEQVLDPVFEQLRRYVLQHLDQDIGTAELAKVLHWSPRQLQRIFQEQMDTTPLRFVLLIKLEEAAKLLQERRQGIAEIAYQLGFSDPAYFSRVFKKYQGLSPSAYQAGQGLG